MGYDDCNTLGVFICRCCSKKTISFNGPQQRMCFPPHLRTEIDPVSENMCSLVFFFLEYRAMVKFQKKKQQFQIWSCLNIYGAVSRGLVTS
jgi:hypothetical protein